MTGLYASTAPTIHVPHVDYLSILPMLIMLGGAVALMLVSSLLRRVMGASAGTLVAVTVSVAALVAALFQWDHVATHGPSVTIAGAIAYDGFAVFIQVTVAIAMLLTALVADGYLEREGIDGPEFHVLAMVSASGAMMMGAANDLIVVFLGLEILSIALYVLAAFNHRRAESGEAALKYFVLGGFSSAVFVYGIALTYGATGTTNLPQIADYLSRNVIVHNGVLLAGLALLLVGFGFKIAAVPFHMWSPDVYEGSPSPVAGFMAAVAKAGAFAALLRVFVTSFPTVRADWQPIVWVLACLSLVLGAVVALTQRDVKRMMAYSSVNHVGFILLGVEACQCPGRVGLALLRVHLSLPGHRLLRRDHRGGRTGRHPLVDHRLPGVGQASAASGPVLRRAAARPGRCAVHHGLPGQVGRHRGLGLEPGLHAGRRGHASGAVAAFFYLRLAVTMFSPVGLVGDADDGGVIGTDDPTSGIEIPSGTDGASTDGSQPASILVLTDAAPERRGRGPRAGAGPCTDRRGHRHLRGVHRGVRNHPRAHPQLRPPGHPAPPAVVRSGGSSR